MGLRLELEIFSGGKAWFVRIELGQSVVQNSFIKNEIGANMSCKNTILNNKKIWLLTKEN